MWERVYCKIDTLETSFEPYYLEMDGSILPIVNINPKIPKNRVFKARIIKRENGFITAEIFNGRKQIIIMEIKRN